MTIVLGAGGGWEESLAIGSFVLTLVGFVVTLASLVYAIRQVKLAKSAAEAARDAAQATFAESHRKYLGYIAGNSQRFVNEVIIHVGNQAWHLAALRSNDLADQMAQMASADPECQRFVEQLRGWSVTLKRLEAHEITRFASARWSEFLRELQAKIDSYYGPFLSTQRELSNES